MASVQVIGYLECVLIVFCFESLARRLGVDSHENMCID